MILVPNRLQVWLNETHVADLERRRRNDARIRIRYTDEAIERWPLNAPIVSCSLPLSSRPQDALPFLRGLLPEGDALAALAARARISAADTFGLLEHYGRDVAGALVIGSDAPDERRFGLEPYDEESLTEEVGSLDENPLGIHDDSELSLPGVQNKLLLVKTEDGWARPQHGRPSTHILKAEDRRFPGIAQAEFECLQLARAVGLTPVESEFLVLGNIPCLITQRYDRLVVDSAVTRMHQEDLCQAVGIDGSGNRGRAKYQRRSGGGPGFRAAARLLDAYAADATAELKLLVSMLAFHLATGNADAHAKNLSFIHTETAISLAPVYDTTPTLLWPSLTEEMAMSVNNRFSLQTLTVSDIVEEAGKWPLARDAAEQAAMETIERVAAGVGVVSSEELADVISGRCQALLAGAAADSS